MSPRNDDAQLLPDGIDVELLEDLESQTIDAIRKQRKHDRYEVEIRLRIRPGNASAPPEQQMPGETRDLSTGGCRAQFSRPDPVGDVYRLEFLDETLHLPTVFARCVRCVMIREDVFEAGFTFFTPVTLEFQGPDAPDDLLG